MDDLKHRRNWQEVSTQFLRGEENGIRQVLVKFKARDVNEDPHASSNTWHVSRSPQLQEERWVVSKYRVGVVAENPDKGRYSLSPFLPSSLPPMFLGHQKYLAHFPSQAYSPLFSQNPGKNRFLSEFPFEKSFRKHRNIRLFLKHVYYPPLFCFQEQVYFMQKCNIKCDFLTRRYLLLKFPKQQNMRLKSYYNYNVSISYLNSSSKMIIY